MARRALAGLGVVLTTAYFVVALRRLCQGITTGEALSDVASDEPAYDMKIDENPEAAATSVRYIYDSLTTPKITYQVEAATGARTVLKRTPAPGYDPALYVTERVWAPARDGARGHHRIQVTAR